MPEPDDFQARQYAFAAHIRDPDRAPAPTDVDDRRMAVYRSLFFNNVRKLLAGTFPILSEILGEARWSMLVRDFYRDHRSRSPLFPDVPREFLQYLMNERVTAERSDPEPDPAFMTDLAHYEWVEAGLLLAPDPSPDKALDPAGDLLEDIPRTSELAWLLSYSWPVHEIGPGKQPTEPLEQPVYFMVYRDEIGDVRFTRLNPVSARLLEKLQSNETESGRALLERLAQELNHPDPRRVVASGQAMLNQWRGLGVVIGTHPARG